MVLITSLLASLLLAPTALGAAVPRAAAPAPVRRQVTPHPTLRPIRAAELGALMGSRVARRDVEADGFELTQKEELLYGLAGGAWNIYIHMLCCVRRSCAD